MKTRVRTLVVLCLAMGVDKAPADEPAKAKPADPAAYEVKPVILRAKLVENGLLEAAANPSVYSMVDGETTINALVPEGTKVKKGQLVCELDTTPLQDQLKAQETGTRGAEAAHMNAQLSREVAELSLQEFTEGTAKQQEQKFLGEIALARAGIERAVHDLEQTQRVHKRISDALNAKGEAQSPSDMMAGLQISDRLEHARAYASQRKYELEMTETKKKVFERFTRQKTTMEIRNEIEKSKSNELAKAQLWDLEKAKERRIHTQMERCKIHAPGDGIVIYAADPSSFNGQLPIAEGAPVRRGQKILSVADLSEMRVTIKVREGLLDRITVGLKARIELDRFPGEILEGAIAEVATVAERHSRLDPSEKVYSAKIKISKATPGLRPGMTAWVEVPVAALDHALCVPVQAVLRYDDKDHVAVLKPDAVEWREVTLGMSDGSVVEIRKGIKSGEIVAPTPLPLMSTSEQRKRFGRVLGDRADAPRDSAPGSRLP